MSDTQQTDTIGSDADAEAPVQRVAELADLPPGGMLVVERAGREVLLCRQGDAVYAVDNLCSHAAERLCNGKLKGNRLFCPLHGAAFDITSGAALSRPASRPIASYVVELRDGAIYLGGARQG